jgi:hypothetical protein
LVVQHRFPLLLKKARSRNVNINSGSNRLFHRGSDYSHPRNLYSHPRNPYSHPPGIFIHIAPESLFTCPGIRIIQQNAHYTHQTGLAFGLALCFVHETSHLGDHHEVPSHNVQR